MTDTTTPVLQTFEKDQTKVNFAVNRLRGALTNLSDTVNSSTVRYDTAQSLTNAQQVQARSNIFAAPFDALAFNGMQINGSMDVSQKNGTASQTINTKYIIDGWQLNKNGTMVIAAQQGFNVSYFQGIPNILFITVSTAQGSLGAGDFTGVYQQIEGWRVARLAFGLANAQSITIGFWTAHHRTGVYTGAVRNGASNRSYAFSYTQAVADVVQFNTITIPGDTGGTWAVDNTAGMVISFTMAAAAGGTFTAPSLNTWLAGNYIAGVGQVNGVAATSDVFRITGVVVLPGIEVPSAARSPLIMRPFPQELEICRRYYQRSSDFNLAYGLGISGGGVYQTILLSPLMRAAPTAVVYSYNSGLANASYDANAPGDRSVAYVATGQSAFTWNVSAPTLGSIVGTIGYYNLQYQWSTDARL